jgi:hypothetical protein
MKQNRKNKGNVSTTDEFITKLSDGRSVSINGFGKMNFNCDCCNKNHLEWVDVESVVLIKNDKETVLSEDEIDLVREELEQLIEENIYNKEV